MDNKELISRIKLYLFDLDGTLYLGEQLFPFTKELLREIQRTGGQYLFMTNNSSKSVADYVKKLARLGIASVPDDFVTSSQAMAHYLHAHHEGKCLYVCGTESLKAELSREGFPIVAEPARAECVVMGFDTELTFQKLRDVSWLLTTHPELPYLATNGDLVCPTEFGFVPDCGSVCAMLKTATGRTPRVIGKPAPLMPQLAMARLGCSKEETAVVGDRIYTDVKSGLNAGITGVLVLSGETTQEILDQSADKPHLVLRDCGEIVDVLRETPTAVLRTMPPA